MDKNQISITQRFYKPKGGSLLAGSFFVHPIAEALTTWDLCEAIKDEVGIIGTGVRMFHVFGRERRCVV